MTDVAETPPRRFKPPRAMTIVAAMLLLVAAGTAVFLWQASRWGVIGAGYVAKQMCSCLFVANRTYESCLTDFDPEVLDLMDITFIDRKVIVNASGLNQAASELTPGFGCSVEDFSGGGF